MLNGLTAPVLFLSFDCDTPEDATAAKKLVPLLQENGISVTLAVPGIMLKENRLVYRELSDMDIEFMNHGTRPHTKWSGEQYIPMTFYNELSTNEVIEDILLGHEAVIDVTGRPPNGFRAPHFGCYQADDQLALVHRHAVNLDYEYCSTTLPERGLAHGPAYKVDSLWEFPVLGSFSNPTCALDSWTYLNDRINYHLDDSYFRLMAETVKAFVRMKIPGILSWYVDPSHVIGQPAFDRALEFLAHSGIESVTGSGLAAMLDAASQPAG